MNLPILLSLLATTSVSPPPAATMGAPPPPPPGKSAWLVGPLAPGQEAVAQGAEQTLGALVSGDRGRHLVGRAALAEHVRGREASLDCVLAVKSCPDPLATTLTELGLERITYIGVAQDARGFTARVYHLGAGGPGRTGEASGARLPETVAGALGQVVTIAAPLQLTSNPPGARVLIDGAVVGTTPLATQVMAGERTVRIEQVAHKPFESRFAFAMAGGPYKLEAELAPLPTRLVAQVSPPHASVFVDGQPVGRGRIQHPVKAGPHVVRFAAAGYTASEITVHAARGADTEVARTLAPIPLEEHIYGRQTYAQIGAEGLALTGIGGVEGSRGGGTTLQTLSGLRDEAPLLGFAAEYGRWKRHFGMMALGASYHASTGDWGGTVRAMNGDTGRTEDQTIRVRTTVLGLRLAQPAVRVALSRFQLALQAGPELRVGIWRQTDGVEFRGGFLGASLDLAVQPSVRVFMTKGLSAELAFRSVHALSGKMGGGRILRAGVGYAF